MHGRVEESSRCVLPFRSSIKLFLFLDYALARGPGPGTTGEAMIVNRDLAPGELLDIKLTNMARQATVNLQTKHLIKVAIVQPAVPTHGNGVPAHNVGNGGGIERRSKARHVVRKIIALNEIIEIAASRAVR